MDNEHRAILAKVAQDAGVTDINYVAGLDPQDEMLIRNRTMLASKLKHLPPGLAYSLTGGLPLTDSPETNIALQQALDEAADSGAGTRSGLMYGLPAAAAGALLGHLAGGGDVATTALSGAGAGLGVGAYARHRKRQRQRELAEGLHSVREQYQSALERAAAVEMESRQRMMRARRMEALQRLAQQQQAQLQEHRSRENRLRKVDQVRKTATIDPSASSAPKPFNAADPRRSKLDEDVDRGSKAMVDSYAGSVPEKLASTRIRWLVQSVAAEQRKLANYSPTGNQMGVTGSPAPQTPGSQVDLMKGVNAPRLTPAPADAPKGARPAGTSTSSTTISKQPAPKLNPNPSGGANAGMGVPSQTFTSSVSG